MSDDPRTLDNKLTLDRGTSDKGVPGPASDPFRLMPTPAPEGKKPIFDLATGQVRIDPSNFPPPAVHNRQDIEALRSTSPERVAGRYMLDLLTGILGEGTAHAPESAQRAARDQQKFPPVGPAEQAMNIALFLLPIERIFGRILVGARNILRMGRSATTAEKAFARDLAVVPSQAEKAVTSQAEKAATPHGEITVIVEPEKGVAGTAAHDPFAGTFGTDPYPAAGGKTPAPHLVRGNFGERMAADYYASEGHRILSYKPDIAGTNQPGIDIVSIKDGVVYFIDNKALTREGNISSVSALTKNLAKNINVVLNEFQRQLARSDISTGERQLLAQAVSAIQAKRYVLHVTNANLSSAKILSGVTETLSKQGLIFVDVFSRP